MGFRSTFTTEDRAIRWPQWFMDKYASTVHFRGGGVCSISAKIEQKTYDTFQHLHTDIQRSIDWSDACDSFVLVYLHECGGITRCQIERDAIRWTEPQTWRQTGGVEHNYCYGCSDAKE